MRNHTAEERYNISFRVTRDLLEDIRKLAKRDSRSVNSYLTAQLLRITEENKSASAPKQHSKNK